MEYFIIPYQATFPDSETLPDMEYLKFPDSETFPYLEEFGIPSLPDSETLSVKRFPNSEDIDLSCLMKVYCKFEPTAQNHSCSK